MARRARRALVGEAEPDCDPSARRDDALRRFGVLHCGVYGVGLPPDEKWSALIMWSKNLPVDGASLLRTHARRTETAAARTARHARAPKGARARAREKKQKPNGPQTNKLREKRSRREQSNKTQPNERNSKQTKPQTNPAVACGAGGGPVPLGRDLCASTASMLGRAAGSRRSSSETRSRAASSHTCSMRAREGLR